MRRQLVAPAAQQESLRRFVGQRLLPELVGIVSGCGTGLGIMVYAAKHYGSSAGALNPSGDFHEARAIFALSLMIAPVLPAAAWLGARAAGYWVAHWAIRRRPDPGAAQRPAGDLRFDGLVAAWGY